MLRAAGVEEEDIDSFSANSISIDHLSPPFDKSILENLKRRDLQALCKRFEIKCSGKNVELIEKLVGAEFVRQQFEGMTISEEDEVKEEIVAVEDDKIDEIQEEILVTPTIITDTVVEIPQELEANMDIEEESVIEDESIQESLIKKSSSPSIPLEYNNIKMQHPQTPPTATNPNAAIANKKKFDLAASLSKPLSYKPHRGPLKPFTL